VLGVRNIIVRSMKVIEEESDEVKPLRPYGLSLKDAEAIAHVCEFDERIASSWESQIDARTYEGNMKTTIIGVTPAYASIFNIKTASGTFVLDYHLENYANVCIIGKEVKQELFGFTDPLYKMVKLNDQWFRVIGVIQERKASSVVGVAIPSANSVVFIPLTTAMAKYSRDVAEPRRFRGRNQATPRTLDRSTIDQIAVQIDKETSIEDASAIVKAILLQRHNQQEDFTVTIPEELIEQSQKTQRIFNIVMGAIAGISLLVGGIGIMNIMLASVLERTREIGIRRAIGATRQLVIVQFLAEATMLSVMGGLAGIILGWGLTAVITAYAGWRTIMSVFSIILAFTVAAATGILFGYYPAKRAADADVIEALRYE
jgi:putative ABC transport system permease protein